MIALLSVVSAIDDVVVVLAAFAVCVVVEVLVVLVVVELDIPSVELAFPSALTITSELLKHHNIEQ